MTGSSRRLPVSPVRAASIAARMKRRRSPAANSSKRRLAASRRSAARAKKPSALAACSSVSPVRRLWVSSGWAASSVTTNHSPIMSGRIRGAGPGLAGYSAAIHEPMAASRSAGASRSSGTRRKISAASASLLAPSNASAAIARPWTAADGGPPPPQSQVAAIARQRRCSWVINAPASSPDDKSRGSR